MCIVVSMSNYTHLTLSVPLLIVGLSILFLLIADIVAARQDMKDDERQEALFRAAIKAAGDSNAR